MEQSTLQEGAVHEGETFCLHCFALLPVASETCPVCGARTDGAADGDYREKLVHALLHPLGEVRQRAIIAIGLRHDRAAADALVACALRNPADIVEGLQIVDVLKVIDDGGPRLSALHYLHARHPATAVKQAAWAAIVASTVDGDQRASGGEAT